jgi:hypothetical protein
MPNAMVRGSHIRGRRLWQWSEWRGAVRILNKSKSPWYARFELVAVSDRSRKGKHVYSQTANNGSHRHCHRSWVANLSFNQNQFYISSVIECEDVRSKSTRLARERERTSREGSNRTWAELLVLRCVFVLTLEKISKSDTFFGVRGVRKGRDGASI